MMMKTFLQQHFATTNIPIQPIHIRAVCKKSYNSLVPITLKSVAAFCNRGGAAYYNNKRSSDNCVYRQNYMSTRLLSSKSSNRRNPNLYDILKVSKTATQKEIKLAYFREVSIKLYYELLTGTFYTFCMHKYLNLYCMYVCM